MLLLRRDWGRDLNPPSSSSCSPFSLETSSPFLSSIGHSKFSLTPPPSLGFARLSYLTRTMEACQKCWFACQSLSKQLWLMMNWYRLWSDHSVLAGSLISGLCRQQSRGRAEAEPKQRRRQWRLNSSLIPYPNWPWSFFDDDGVPNWLWQTARGEDDAGLVEKEWVCSSRNRNPFFSHLSLEISRKHIYFLDCRRLSLLSTKATKMANHSQWNEVV